VVPPPSPLAADLPDPLRPPAERNTADPIVTRTVTWIRLYLTDPESVPTDCKNLLDDLAALGPNEKLGSYLFKVEYAPGDTRESENLGILRDAAKRTLELLTANRLTTIQVKLLRDVATPMQDQQTKDFGSVILRPFIYHPGNTARIKTRDVWLDHFLELVEASTGDDLDSLATLVAFAIFQRLEAIHRLGVSILPVTNHDHPSPGFGPDPTPAHASLLWLSTRLDCKLCQIDLSRMRAEIQNDNDHPELQRMYDELASGIQRVYTSDPIGAESLAAVRAAVRSRNSMEGMFGLNPEDPSRLRFLIEDDPRE